MKIPFDLPRFKFASNPVKYDQIREDKVAEEECFVSAAEQISKSNAAARQKHCLFYFLFLQSIIISILATYVILNRTPSDLACARQLSPYCEIQS
jgi:hypothetical protein